MLFYKGRRHHGGERIKKVKGNKKQQTGKEKNKLAVK